MTGASPRTPPERSADENEAAVADPFTAARAVLTSAAPETKTAAAARAGEILRSRRGAVQFPADAAPERPARPPEPRLAPPNAMPRRRLTSKAGRTALLHAVAHIEFNAIDLAFDMAVRFAPEIERAGLDAQGFFADWVGVGVDEARHFMLVTGRLAALGARYGDLPAHDGLWTAAAQTADSVLARLAVAPMVLEARGLDVTPGMIAKLQAAGDDESADALGVIYREEIGHVAAGRAWFERVCASRGLEAETTFRRLVSERFQGALKPPFNHRARAQAGLAETYYGF